VVQFEPITNPYVADILAQPDKLRAFKVAAAIDAARPVLVDIGQYDRILLTGMGASHAALRPLWLAMLARELPAWLLDTSEVLEGFLPLINSETLVIAASQSGRSAEIVALADAVAERGATLLAITNDLDGALAVAADAAVDIGAGPEAAVSTGTYLNTVAACLTMAAFLESTGSAPSFVAVADVAEGYLESWRARVDRIADSFGTAERLYVLARGASMAAAAYGALICKEAAKRPVEASGAAQFRHGPLELADNDLTVVLLPGGPPRERALNAALERDLARFGARVFRLDAGPEDDVLWFPRPPTPSVRSILEPLPLQLMTIALAETGGFEPGVFRHLRKVTIAL
jgi:glutamine---fructose-6-phosphate transaminase (isomerizing)